METQSYNLPQNAWFGDEEMEIYFPADWEIMVADIPADQQNVLGEDDLKRIIDHPLGTPSLPELAGRRKKAVIIFDDLSRPTKIEHLASYVVYQLLQGGIEKHQISFVSALGAHGAHNRLDFEKKLGKDLVHRFPVYNHNPYENCMHVGETRNGTPLYFNREVMSADLKIGIGCIIPHAFNGFGGGGKIVLPGISGIETIHTNHTRVLKDLNDRNVGFVGNMGLCENSKMQDDINDAVKAIGLDFLINVLPNSSRNEVAVVAGEPITAYKVGVEQAKKLYATPFYDDADVVIANANAKASEALIAMLLGIRSLKETGGDLVTVVNCPAGQIVHYLFGKFGENCGGRLWSGNNNLPKKVTRSIVYSKCSGQRFGLHDDAIEFDDWEEVLKTLLQRNGSGTRVVIYRDGTMQYLNRK